MTFRALGVLGMVFGLALFEFAACDSSAEDTSAAGGQTSQGGAGAQGGAGGAGGEGGAVLQDCDALGVALQATLDESLEAEVAANPERVGGTVGAVITPYCRWVGATGESSDGDPLRPDDLLRLASATKTYTAAAVLHAVDDGLLTLDDTVASKITTGLMHEDTMTVRQLLNHTAGVANYFDDDAFLLQTLTNPLTPVAPQELIDVAIALGPNSEPGGAWSYSNTHYIVLGLMLEEVTGKPLHEYIRSELLTPLGLERTFFQGEEQLPQPLADGWIGEDFATNLPHPSVGWAAGAMVADVGDLADWMHAFVVGDAVPAALRPEMLDYVQLGSDYGYGLGVLTFPNPNIGPAVGHDGALPGYEVEAYHLTESDILVAIITNNRDSDDFEVWTKLANSAEIMTPAPQP